MPRQFIGSENEAVKGASGRADGFVVVLLTGGAHPLTRGAKA